MEWKLIGHQTIGMHLPAGFRASPAQRFHKALPIQVIPENRLPVIAPAHHVVKRPRVFHSQFSRHAKA